MHFAGNLAVVACDPNGAPYALVIPVLDPSGQGSVDTPAVTVYRRENDQWTEFVTWSYGYNVWHGALFFDLAVDHNGSVWLPGFIGDGTQGRVISAVLHFDGNDWHIYVGAEEDSLDDPLARVGGTLEDLQNLQVHKTLPPGYEQPTTFPQGIEWSFPQWLSDIDIAADGTIWLSRPFLWPQRLDGQKWHSVVEPELFAHLSPTLDALGLRSSENVHTPGNFGLLGLIPPENDSGLAGLGALDADGAPWLGVIGGVLHREAGHWILYRLPASDRNIGTLVPLASGADGSTWFWHSEGLLRYDGVVWQKFTGDESFRETVGDPFGYSPGPYLDAVVGPDGALWIGGLRFLPGGTPLSLPKELAQ